MNKTCSECGVSKPIERFHRHAGMASGYYNQCKLCMAQSQRNRRHEQRQPDPINELLQRWGHG